MPRSLASRQSSSSARIRSLASQPALIQLYEFAAADLDQILSRWLTALSLSLVGVVERHSRTTTYQAALGEHPASIKLRVRVYQRKHRLEVRHVEAFAGHLLRTRSPIGVLITTGTCAPDAILAAEAIQVPDIALLSGDEWMAELAQHRVGVKRRFLSQWAVELTTRLCPSPPGRARKPRGGG